MWYLLTMLTATIVDGGGTAACGVPAIEGDIAPSGGTFENTYGDMNPNGVWTLGSW